MKYQERDFDDVEVVSRSLSNATELLAPSLSFGIDTIVNFAIQKRKIDAEYDARILEITTLFNDRKDSRATKYNDRIANLNVIKLAIDAAKDAGDKELLMRAMELLSQHIAETPNYFRMS